MRAGGLVVDREYLLTIFVLVGATASMALANAWLVWREAATGLSIDERLEWRRLWTPLAVAVVSTAWSWGWWLLEPENAESVPSLFVLAALLAGYVWLRALVRAIKSQRDSRRPAAYTSGFLRPRIVIDPAFAELLDEVELAAVQAHEQAHVRHRDPLRVWLAQWCADLQWPSGAARRWLLTWRAALEMARDDEARRDGVDGADLGSALVKAARFGFIGGRSCVCFLGERDAFRARIVRLLSPIEPKATSGRHASRGALALFLMFGIVAAGGALFGEAVVRTLLAW